MKKMMTALTVFAIAVLMTATFVLAGGTAKQELISGDATSNIFYFVKGEEATMEDAYAAIIYDAEAGDSKAAAEDLSSFVEKYETQISMNNTNKFAENVDAVEDIAQFRSNFSEAVSEAVAKDYSLASNEAFIKVVASVNNHVTVVEAGNAIA